jgi:hypothetical protein
LLQTLSVPHAFPFGRFVAVSVHEMAGEQAVLPVWQGLVGWQSRPAEHATHAPPLHTIPVPHEVPLATFPESRQTGAPVLHTVVPDRQGFPATTQDAPLTHAVQVPAALHTIPVPHEVPADKLLPLSVHCGVGPVQTRPPA